MKEIFDDEFVLQLLKISLKDKSFLEILIQFLKPEFLPTDEHRKVWRSIVTEFNLSENSSLPAIPVLKQHFRKDIDVLEILSSIKEVKVEDTSDILRNLEEFLRQNMFVQYYNEMGELYNKGKKDAAYKTFVSKADEFTNFSLKTKTLEKVFGDFNKRTFEREMEKISGSKRKRIPTGIDELDALTNGGFETGEFVLIVGDSGSGKSFLGNHLGVNAARRGIQVYHAQAEGTKQQVMGRYDSAWSGTKYFDIKENNLDERKQSQIRRVLDNISGEIHVEAFEKFNSKTIIDVRNSIRELKKKYNIEYVIMDYLDLIDPGDGHVYSPNMERFRHQKVSKACKDIAVEENVVFVTFTQASSIDPDKLNDPNFVITRFNLAEDKGKVRPVDTLLSINQTRDEKKNQIGRLHIDKAREHSGNATIYYYQNLKHSRFYDRKRTLNEFYRVNENE